jgi:hypothetical protein
VVVPAPDVYVKTLDHEKVLFVGQHGSLQHLDRMASLVWDCLGPSTRIGDIVEDLAKVFRADPLTVRDDVVTLLVLLMEEDAIVLAESVGGVISDA